MYVRIRRDLPVRAVCSLCAQDIYAGEMLWQYSGITVCEDCFLQFAHEMLRPFAYLLGEESAR